MAGEKRVEHVSALVRKVLLNNETYAEAVAHEIVQIGKAVMEAIRAVVKAHPAVAADINPLADAIELALKLEFETYENEKGEICTEVYKWDDEFSVCAPTREILALKLIAKTLERLGWEMNKQLEAILQ